LSLTPDDCTVESMLLIEITFSGNGSECERMNWSGNSIPFTLRAASYGKTSSKVCGCDRRLF